MTDELAVPAEQKMGRAPKAFVEDSADKDVIKMVVGVGFAIR